MPLRGAPSARVAIPQGDLYPSGIPVVVPNDNIQSTVRPEGSFFLQSSGYHTIRPGSKRFQDGFRGPGIGFTPLRYAENVAQLDDLPALVDQDDAMLHADIAEIPGSNVLDDRGQISEAAFDAGYGTKHGNSDKTFPHHDGVSHPHGALMTTPDMGDRRPDRPLTRQWLQGVLHDPLSAFQEEYRTHPITAIVVAASGISLAYWIGREFDSQYGSRGGNAGAAAPAGVATAGSAAQRGGNVVSDLIEGAGKAVKGATDTIADAVK
jgi:hypothetical protein